MTFSTESIRIDPSAEADRIVEALRRTVRVTLRRSGGVVGISGGVDSAVVLALCARAFGPEKLVALIMPERDSDPLSATLGSELAAKLGVTPIVEEITSALEGARCYERRDEAVRRVFPHYDPAVGYRMKIWMPPNELEKETFNAFLLTIVAPDQRESTRPLSAPEFLQIVAASNLKQRTRMEMLYYHAEMRNYAVVGTTNKDEHDQGFFVKYGDGGADVMAIGHLYKSQIYQLAEYLDVPAAIRERAPTTDTYSAPCDQTEFFFRMPFGQLDVLWHAWESMRSPADVASATGLAESQVEIAFADFARKKRATEYLRLAPIYIP
ncbi:MAG: NAD(+) synthase [Burkholderiales bacterium]